VGIRASGEEGREYPMLKVVDSKSFQPVITGVDPPGRDALGGVKNDSKIYKISQKCAKFHQNSIKKTYFFREI
jgi:hypothetical protein